jgi:hypothetical protein
MIDLEQIAYDIGVGKSQAVTRWMLPIATLEEMIALIRKQEAAIAAPAAPVRADFEAWAVNNGMHDLTPAYGNGPDHGYMRDPLNICWEAYKAAIAQRAASVEAVPLCYLSKSAVGQLRNDRPVQVSTSPSVNSIHTEAIYTAPPAAAKVAQDSGRDAALNQLFDGPVDIPEAIAEKDRYMYLRGYHDAAGKAMAAQSKKDN